jgi:hypothetical protein
VAQQSVAARNLVTKRKYIVLRPEAVIATALWTITAWAHEGAAHSPILAAISVEPNLSADPLKQRLSLDRIGPKFDIP